MQGAADWRDAALQPGATGGTEGVVRAQVVRRLRRAAGRLLAAAGVAADAHRAVGPRRPAGPAAPAGIRCRAAAGPLWLPASRLVVGEKVLCPGWARRADVFQEVFSNCLPTAVRAHGLGTHARTRCGTTYPQQLINAQQKPMDDGPIRAQWHAHRTCPHRRMPSSTGQRPQLPRAS